VDSGSAPTGSGSLNRGPPLLVRTIVAAGERSANSAFTDLPQGPDFQRLRYVDFG
jgi:hypothetical protein